MIRGVQRVGSRAGAARLRAALRRPAAGADDGFVLLESIVAITLITIVMAALATFFVSGISSTNQQRARQTATHLADSTVDTLRSMPSSDLVSGRDYDSVTAQFAAAPSVVSPWVDSGVMTREYDPSATSGSGATAPVPTSATSTTVNKRTYKISRYVGKCAIKAGGSDTDCTSANLGTPTNVPFLRAVVAVQWPDKNCTAGTCTYVTATLLTLSGDPTFNLHQIASPAPVVDNPGAQSSTVGAPVTLALHTKDGTGVPTYTWSSTSTFPAGLTLSPAGVVSGTPTAKAANVSITVTVTDAFLRTASATFTWTVLPALDAPSPGPQAATAGTAIPTLTLSASGGSGPPYTWSDPKGTLPPGLTIATAANQGQITGTPTTPGTFPVTVQVSDAGGHQATVAWTWTVGYGTPVPATPQDQTSTVGQAVKALQLTAATGSGDYSWTVSGLPAGITATTEGVISGTPSATADATVAVTVRDTATGRTATTSFGWKVVDRPTVTSPGDQAWTVGATVTGPSLSTCPNTPCQYTLNTAIPGVSVTSAGLTGVQGGSATTYTGVTVTVTDAAGASATTAGFSWTVNPAITVADPGTQTAFGNRPATLDVSALVTGGSGSYTYTSNGLPDWLTMDPTGVISGTAPAAKTVSSPITVTVADSTGGVTTSAAFTWIVTDLRLAIPDRHTAVNKADSFDVDGYLSGGTTPYTYSTSTLPSWLKFDTTSHVISLVGPPTTSRKATITVTVTDKQGARVSSTFQWYVSSLWVDVSDQQSALNAAVTLNLTGAVTGTASSVTATNLPGWLSYNAATKTLSGTAPSKSTVARGIVITATESGTGFTVTRTIDWYVTDLTFSIPDQWSGSWRSVSLSAAGYVTGGTGPYTFDAVTLPSWLTLDPGTGVLSGTTPWTWSSRYYTVTVRVTDQVGATATTSFTWRVG